MICGAVIEKKLGVTCASTKWQRCSLMLHLFMPLKCFILSLDFLIYCFIEIQFIQHQIHPFKVCSSVAVSIFRVLQSLPLSNCKTLPSPPATPSKKPLYLLINSLHSPLLTVTGNHYSTFCLWNLPTLDITCKGNHTVCGFVWFFSLSVIFQGSPTL